MYSVGDRSLSSKVREGKARGILSVGVSDRTYYTLLGAGGESHTCSVWVYRQGHLFISHSGIILFGLTVSFVSFE